MVAIAAFACSLASAATAAAPSWSDRKLIDFTPPAAFDNLGHLAGAIDTAGAGSVAVRGIRGVWGLEAPLRFAGSFEPELVAATRVGVQWEIAGLRDLVVVTSATDAPEFGHSTGGAVVIRSKLGSNTLDPATGGGLGRISPPGNLQSNHATAYTFVTTSSSSIATYYAANGTVVPLARSGDPVPGRPGTTFVGLGSKMGMDSSSVLFHGTSSEVGPGGIRYGAVYRYDRSSGSGFTPVLENLPATDAFGGFADLDLNFGKMAVGSGKGLFLTGPFGVSPQNIVPRGTEYEPGKALHNFGDIQLGRTRIAFTSFVGGRSAAFLTDFSGNLQNIADSSTPVPGGIGNFMAVQQLGLSEDLIAFIGFDGSFAQAGLFGYSGGSLFRIAGPGDSKDGKTVRIVDFLPDAIDENLLAYTAYFTDGSATSYLVAVVPEPRQRLLLAVGLCIVIALAARRASARA